LLESRLRRIGVLRSQVWDLENQVTQLSQALAKNQALLAESSRLKFLQLASPSNASGVASTPRLSADLQRTLFFAMARELGWLTPAEIEALRDGPPGTAPNRIAVEFVDLRPGTNRLANLPQLPKADAQVAYAAASTPPPTSPPTSGAAIPAFISGDNMVLAIDSSLAPTGSAVTFWAGTPGQQQPLGTTVIGENPAAVTIPFVSTSASGWNVTVIAATPGGGSNVIGQFSAHATTSP